MKTIGEHMPTIDLSSWNFSFGGDPRFKDTEFYQPPEEFDFATHVELLQHLALDDTRDSGFQNDIQDRLKRDATVKHWHRLRTPIGDTEHFKSYRSNRRYQDYHDAAIAVGAGCARTEQQDMVSGLDAEIAASRIVVPAGQVLFHGRGDRGLEAMTPYSSFVSTSLDPTVCIYHANKRSLPPFNGTRASIYALTVGAPLHAMWGNGGSLKEWELLLPTKLTCKATQVHTAGRFDIIEATIGP